MRIGIVEDDFQLNNAIAVILEKENYEVVQGYSCLDGINMLEQNLDLLLLDVNLPDGEGFEVCRRFSNETKVPTIFLTARDEEIDMIKAFDNGCEDYIVKPFSMLVLLKKIKVVSRRNKIQATTFMYKQLQIDFNKHEVRVDGKTIKLTAKEYELLCVLANHKGKVMTKQFLLEQVWDTHGQYVDDNTVSVTINRLRKKIDIQNQPSFITNIFGTGYMFGE